jgi:UrcA family protein
MSTAITKLTTFRGTLAYLAVFAASGATVALAAAPTDEAPSVRVRYDDLNLSSVAGTNALYQRIVKAARDVCPDAYSSRDMDTRVASERCQAAAIAKAVRDVNSPQLAAIHASHVSHG